MMFDCKKLYISFLAILLSLTSSVVFSSSQPKKAHHSHKTAHHVRKHKPHKSIHQAKHASHKSLPELSSSNVCRSSGLDLDQFAQTTTIAGLGEEASKTDVVDFVSNAVKHLHYSDYKLGGTKFDSSRGVYVLDCSNFVDHILAEASPNAYSSLVNATGADAPATQHYYHFFQELSEASDTYWNKVETVSDLRPGDILVFRYKNRHGVQTGGHVMVVMNKPLQNEDVFLVRVADSARSGHSEDTRPALASGIGIGTLLLKANAHTGHPAAYAWGLNGYWNHNVNIAMARPLDVG